MFGWSLTRKRKSDPRPASEGPSPFERLRRLEIEMRTLREDLDLQTIAQKKLTGRVSGLIGVPARQRLREAAGADHNGETLEEYRERMRREGRLSAAASEAINREGH